MNSEKHHESWYTTMLIYRVQDDEGFGYYKSSVRPKIWFSEIRPDLEYDRGWYLPDGSERAQQPDADYGSDLQTFLFARNENLEGYLFGFEKKKHLFIWWSPSYLGYLEATGRSVWLYDVPEEFVVKGTRQLIFRADKVNWCKKLNTRELRKTNTE